MTYMRISGTYRQLLDRLEEDGFAPLHYELYWVMKQIHPAMTPIFMRLVPALCGTLMVPVMYWLAAQLVSRRAAIVTALFTACGAYVLGYSRNSKMYMDFWFFCACPPRRCCGGCACGRSRAGSAGWRRAAR